MKNNNEKMVTNVPYDEYAGLIKFKEKTIEGSLFIYNGFNTHSVTVVNDKDKFIRNAMGKRDEHIKELKSRISYLEEKASKSKSFISDKRVIAACLVVVFCFGVLFSLTFL